MGFRLFIVHLLLGFGDFCRWCLDISEAMGLFGWGSRVPLREGLKRIIEWVKVRLREEGVLS
ncbi:MAG: hypothetical protein DRJ40_02780 [Thermoprotei archaeon]|nr:MAG: hypothetical protein DRJ40_02780 [Thermoprotei archaeon]